jgi:hypothetical protein
MLPECIPHFGEIARFSWKVERAWTRRGNKRRTGENYVMRNISRVPQVKEGETDRTCSMNGEIINP